MSDRASTGATDSRQSNLLRRDWIILPMLSLLTICVIAVATEVIGTLMFPREGDPLASCLVTNNLSTGIRGIPNSTCWNKIPEGTRVENRFNSCGDRAGMECGPKYPGAYRIVLAGSSFVFGSEVAWDSTFAALLPAELSQRTSRKIEVYNEGMVGHHPPQVARHFDAVLNAHPDLILWILTPVDIRNTLVIAHDPDRPSPAKRDASLTPKPAGLIQKISALVTNELAGKSTLDALAMLADHTRSIFLLRHVFYKSQSLYVAKYLMDSDNAGFLRSELTAEWQSRMTHVDAYVADIESQSKAAGVPLVVALVPNRVEAAMISMNKWPAGFDPYSLGRKISTVVTRQGAYYIDILPDFRSILKWTPLSRPFFVCNKLMVGGFGFEFVTASSLKPSLAIPALEAALRSHPCGALSSVRVSPW